MHIQSQIADEFERNRQYLTGLAYRMLGSMSEAQDAVQEAYLRWHTADRAKVANPKAYLSKTVARLCLDQMKSARARREIYVGPWLPEPVLNNAELSADTASEYAHDLSVGLLLALERLSPLERAAFLLHDVFDVGFGEIADLLARNETACRQLAARARDNVRAAHPRFEVAPDTSMAIARAFASALTSGDASGLARLLAKDAVLHSDGGGKVRAALKVIAGRDRIVRFTVGIRHKFKGSAVVDTRFVHINGMPGIVAMLSDGSLTAIALELARDRIVAVYLMRNPDKLVQVAEAIAKPH